MIFRQKLSVRIRNHAYSSELLRNQYPNEPRFWSRRPPGRVDGWSRGVGLQGGVGSFTNLKVIAFWAQNYAWLVGVEVSSHRREGGLCKAHTKCDVAMRLIVEYGKSITPPPHHAPHRTARAEHNMKYAHHWFSLLDARQRVCVCATIQKYLRIAHHFCNGPHLASFFCCNIKWVSTRLLLYIFVPALWINLGHNPRGISPVAGERLRIINNTWFPVGYVEKWFNSHVLNSISCKSPVCYDCIKILSIFIFFSTVGQKQTCCGVCVQWPETGIA